MQIPALVDSRLLRFAALFILYFAQGLPLGLFTISIPAYFAEQGATAAEIGQFITIAGLPWAFKFLAGPIMDRLPIPAYGHRRPWIILCQVGMVMSFISISLTATTDIPLMTYAWMAFSVNCFSCSQDVAVDGMAIGILKDDERAKANSFMFGGQACGRASGALFGGVLLNAFGLHITVILAALCVFFILMVPVALKERQEEKRFPWSPGAANPEILALAQQKSVVMVAELFRRLFKPISLLLILAMFFDSVAGGIVTAYFPSFSVGQLGWDDNDYNRWQSYANLVSIGIAITISPLIDRYGNRIAIIWICVLTSALVFALGFIEAIQTDRMWQLFILVFFSTQMIFTVAVIATCMKVVTRSIAATQFAIYMAMSNLSSSTGSAIIAVWGNELSIENVMFMAGVSFLLAAAVYVSTGLGKREQTHSVSPVDDSVPQNIVEKT